MPRLK